MSTQNGSKINKLISGWPKGTASTVWYLQSCGFSRKLLNKYKNSRWLAPLGHGAYTLFNDKVEWMGALYPLQTQLDLDVHAGGKTALEMKGYAHYLGDKIRKVFLYGRPGTKLPAWFKEHNWGVEVVSVMTNLFPDGYNEGFSEYRERDFTVRISAPERAAMEMLYHVPGKVSFEEALLVMENLSGLRPTLVQDLLLNCNSVKVKRLFMYMAEKHAYPWVGQVDTSKVDFGRGNRSVVAHGTLDKKYKITVPKSTMEEPV
jgi:hypothetical protein